MQKFVIDVLYKITSRKLWIWIISTYLVFRKFDTANGSTTALLIAWGVITLLYYGGDAMDNAVAAMISKAELKLGLGAQVQTNISGTIAAPDPSKGGR
ncbi:MAG: hypothetical protein LBH43_18060 [Treponema sp.]|nr:hypothetical protein [Treponema sp.]